MFRKNITSASQRSGKKKKKVFCQINKLLIYACDLTQENYIFGILEISVEFGDCNNEMIVKLHCATVGWFIGGIVLHPRFLFTLLIQQ